MLEYEHQCAAAAEPIETAGGVTPIFAHAATIEEASKIALDKCPSHNDGRSCEIKFSNCTEPYLVYD